MTEVINDDCYNYPTKITQEKTNEIDMARIEYQPDEKNTKSETKRRIERKGDRGKLENLIGILSATRVFTVVVKCVDK